MGNDKFAERDQKPEYAAEVPFTFGQSFICFARVARVANGIYLGIAQIRIY